MVAELQNFRAAMHMTTHFSDHIDLKTCMHTAFWPCDSLLLVLVTMTVLSASYDRMLMISSMIIMKISAH